MGARNTPYPADLEPSSYLGWEPSLCSAEDNVEEFLGGWHRGNILDVMVRTFHSLVELEIQSSYLPRRLGRHLGRLCSSICVY